MTKIMYYNNSPFPDIKCEVLKEEVVTRCHCRFSDGSTAWVNKASLNSFPMIKVERTYLPPDQGL